MALSSSGNLLTRYGYRHCRVATRRTAATLDVDVETPHAEADLRVRAYVDPPAAAPPPGSPFPDLRTARRYAGPLPFTFDYEPESRRMIVVEASANAGSRLPVRVEIERCTFLARPPFDAVRAPGARHPRPRAGDGGRDPRHAAERKGRNPSTPSYFRWSRGSPRPRSAITLRWMFGAPPPIAMS